MLKQTKDTKVGDHKLPAGGKASISGGTEIEEVEPSQIRGNSDLSRFAGIPHIICSRTNQPCAECGMNGCSDE